MRILALDTSGDVCSVALNADAKTLTEYTFRHERRLTERLPGVIQFVLCDAGCTIKDMEALAVGLGPGSFTGVRVGVTMAKTFALALSIPVVGVSSLDAVAATLALANLPLIVAVPTRRTESIAAFYRPGESVPIAAPQAFANDQIVALGQEALGTERVFLTGEAAPIITSVTPDAFPFSAFSASPSAGKIAALAAERLTKGESDDADTLAPLYVMPPPTG